MADASTPAPDFVGPPRPVRFEERYGSVLAMQFDGTRESASAIAARFPGRLAWSVEREGVLLALAKRPCSHEQLQELKAGSWFIEVDRFYDTWAVMSDDIFRRLYRASPYQGGA